MSTSQKEHSGSRGVEMEGLYTGSHRGEQRRQGRNNSDSEEIQEFTEEDEGSEGWTDYLIWDCTSVWNHEPMIQKCDEDGSQRDGAAAV